MKAHSQLWLGLGAVLSFGAGLCLLLPVFLASPPQNLKPRSGANTAYNLKFQARPFFGGYYKVGDWLPVEISLENFDEPVDLTVEATVPTAYGDASYKTTYRRPISLGQQANKHFTIYLQPNVKPALLVNSISYPQSIVLKKGSETIAEQTIQVIPFSPQDYLVGAIGPEGVSEATGLSNLKVGPLQSRVAVQPLSLADIPDRVEGLHSFDSLIIASTPTESLSQPQVQAIRNWVEAGGQLILMGGSGWNQVRQAFRNEDDFLPFDTTDLDLNAAQLSGNLAPEPGVQLKLTSPLTLSRGQMLKGGHVLAYTNSSLGGGPGQWPFLVERRLGSGRVLVAATDLSHPAILNQPGSHLLWQDLLSFNSGAYANPYYDYDRNLDLNNLKSDLSFLTNSYEVSSPDLGFVWPVLGIYILIVGPLNYFILRRLDRPGWTWVTLPVCAALCTAVILTVGFAKAPGEVAINQMSIIHSGPNQQEAHYSSYAALMTASADGGNYRVTSQNSPYTHSQNQPAPMLSPLIEVDKKQAGSFNYGTVEQTEQPSLDNLALAPGAIRGLKLTGDLPAYNFQLDSALSLHPDPTHPQATRLEGTIRNTTQFPLHNVTLMFGEASTRLKNVVNPGEVVKVSFDLAAALSWDTSAACYSNYGYWTPSSQEGAVQKSSRELAATLQTALPAGVSAASWTDQLRFLRFMFNSGRYGPVDSSNGKTLNVIAWLDQNPLPLAVDGVKSQTKSAQVLVATLPVNYTGPETSSPAQVPNAAFWLQTAGSQTESAAYNLSSGHAEELCLSQGSVTTEYQLPAWENNFKAQQLTLYLHSAEATVGGSFNPILPQQVELFDWQTGHWEELDGLLNSADPANSSIINFQANNILDPARFIEPGTGRLYLRFTVNTPDLRLIVHSDLAVKGTTG